MSSCASCTKCQQYIVARQYKADARHTSPAESGPSTSGGRLKLHRDFASMEKSADRGCTSCKYFVRALLGKCFTRSKAEDMRKSSHAVVITQPVKTALRNVRPAVFKVSCTVEVDVVLLPNDFQTDLDRSRSITSMSGFDWYQRKPRLAGLQERDPKSEILFKHIGEWIQTCHENDIDCRITTGAEPPTSPKRLLDVRGDMPKLVDRSLEHAPYVALSYCWGGDPEVKLLMANLEAFRNAIDLATLEPTIRDAIHVCKALQVPYLWVDALCILQDDGAKDWHAEAGNMNEVFGNAHFTLSICSADRAVQGFLQERWPANLNIKNWILFAGGLLALPSYSLLQVRQNSILATRGWVFQEELLSPRVLYFSDQGVFWRCLSSTRAENGSKPGEEYELPWYLPSLEVCDPHTFMKTKNPLFTWDEMIEGLSIRNFTVPGDALPSLDGLKSLVQQRTGEEYVLGLWKGRLPGHLLWKVVDPPLEQRTPRPPSHTPSLQVPSWTWAAIAPTRGIIMPRMLSFTSRAEVLSIEEVTHSVHLRLCGRVRSLNDDFGMPSEPPVASSSKVKQTVTSSSEARIWAVREATREVIIWNDGKSEIHIQLDHCVPASFDRALCFEINFCGFLLLEPSGDDGTYRRIGCAQSHEDATFFHGRDKLEIILV